ncbi:MAG: glycosyltransferase [Syntrophothermus sp.]
MNMEEKHKPVVSIYTQRYLNTSMTFVYRQISSIINDFDTYIYTSNEVTNRDIYPAEKMFVKVKTPLGSLYRYYKKKTGHYAVLSGAQVRFFSAHIKNSGSSLIHAHFGPSAIEMLPVAERTGLPLLVTFHGYDASSLLYNESYLNDIRPVFRRSYVIAVSEYMAQRLIEKGADPARMRVIYYGISSEKFPFREREAVKEKFSRGETVRFLQVSNFNAKKGHEYTLKAFAGLLKKVKNVKLILAGDGELRENMIKLAAELGIEEYTEFPGSVNPEAVASLMEQADIFVHHSVTAASGDQEGIPNVIMEAMATGLPVISTVHAGIPELITGGVNGYLVPEKDVAAYSHTMECALQGDQRINNKAAETVREKFNLGIQGQKLVETYKDIINGKFR